MTPTQYIILSILCFLLLFRALKYVWDNRFLYGCASKIDGPLALPLIGSAYYFYGGRKAIFGQLWKLVTKYKPLGKIWLGPHLLIITQRPKDVELLLQMHNSKGNLYDFITPLIGGGLLIEPLEKWKLHRKTMNLAFKQKILNSFVDIFSRQTGNSLAAFEQVSGKGQVDLHQTLCEVNFSTICETVMGVRPETLDGQSEYMTWTTRMIRLITSRFFQPWLYPDSVWKLSSAGQEVDMLTRKSRGFVRKMIEMKRHKMVEQNENEESFCFLDHFIQLADNDEEWKEEELMEETQTMMFTGSTSLAVSEEFFLLMMAIHPEIQEKIYVELFSIFGDSDRNITFRDLNEMEHLERAIKETLRLFPVAPYIMRFLEENFDTGSLVFPKGSYVVVPIMYFQRHSRFWQDPLKFDPDRFLPDEVAKRDRSIYLPFSQGPRNCIAQKYAEMAMKSTLSTILRQYKVSCPSYNSTAEIEFEFNLLLKPTKGIRVKVERRQQRNNE